MNTTKRQPTGSNQGHEPVYVEPLTAREQEVLALVAQGLSNGQIAESLVIAEDTVRNHLRAIYGKLGVDATGISARIAAGLRGNMLRYVGPDVSRAGAITDAGDSPKRS